MRYTNAHDKIAEICKTARTFTEVESRLNLTSPSGSLRRYIKVKNIPMPEYLGMSAAALISQRNKKKTTESDLCVGSLAYTGSIKKFLFDNGLKQERCEQCGWAERRSDGKIPVHLHHRNGDTSDNRIENLQILCPNCHSLTDNYAGKNKSNPRRRKEHRERVAYYSIPRNVCEVCGKLGYGEKYCSHECAHIATRRATWPTKEQLADDIEKLSWTAIGRKYGVSDNAVRKWARGFQL